MINKLYSIVTMSCAALMATTAMARAQNMDDLIKAAQAEGELTTIALPHSWCNYGEVIESFKTKYGIKVNELNPDAGSGDALSCVRRARLSRDACWSSSARPKSGASRASSAHISA